MKRQMTSPSGIYSSPAEEADEFSDPESSLFDYQQMNDAGLVPVMSQSVGNNNNNSKDK